MPIPLSLVGFADAFDPWPSYRNHPVVRTRLAGGTYPQMIIRLGLTGQDSVSVRRPVEEVLD